YNAKLWPRDRALIVTMLYQGLRISEAASLTLGDLDFEDQTLRVIGKGNKERLLPLHPRTVKTIRFYLDFWPKRFTPTKKEDRLWRSRNGSPLTVDGARKAVSRQLRRVLGDRYTPHKLRHTFGTRLANLNVDMLVIRDLMGHASISTTQVYTHVQ